MAKKQKGMRWVALILTLVLLESAAAWQPTRASARIPRPDTAPQQDFDEDSVTFDNLLPAASYTLYIEMRNVGRQLQSGGFAEMLAPLLPMLGGGAGEVTGLVAFVAEHAERLSRSRMMVAAMAVNPKLPQVVLAIELSSSESAKDFEPLFRNFITSLMPSVASGAKEKGNPSAPQPFFIKQAGSLIIVSDAQFSFKSLRAEDGKLLTNDPNFRATRDRFYSEILFVYYDIALGNRAARERYEAADVAGQQVEDQNAVRQSAEGPGDLSVEQARPEPAMPPAVATRPDVEIKMPEAGEASSARSSNAETIAPARERRQTPPPQRGDAGKAESKTETIAVADEMPSPSAEAQLETKRADQFVGMFSFLFSGNVGDSKLPQAIALALGLDGGELLIHALLVNDLGVPASPIPFFSSLVSGSPLPPEAAAYAPADTEIFLSASLDLARMYNSILDMAGGPNQTNPGPKKRQKGKAETFETKMAAVEKKHGFKVKDVLLSTLGSEVALSAQGAFFSVSVSQSARAVSQISETSPILFISVQDRIALEPKLLAILEALGLKAADEKGISEKRGEIEMMSYSKLSFAFINNFLVLAQTAAPVRRAIEAYTTNRTLISDRDFHNYMRWQPRNLLAQIYISSAIMKGLFDETKRLAEEADDETRELIEQLNLSPEPITYAADSDVIGPHYELHLPQSLVLMLIAQMTTGANRARIPANEGLTRQAFETLHETQMLYQNEHGRFASADELADLQMFDRSIFDAVGYSFELSASGGKYQATATPVTYGKTGRLSFYIDETGVIREGDHEGKPASEADKPSAQPGRN